MWIPNNRELYKQSIWHPPLWYLLWPVKAIISNTIKKFYTIHSTDIYWVCQVVSSQQQARSKGFCVIKYNHRWKEQSDTYTHRGWLCKKGLWNTKWTGMKAGLLVGFARLWGKSFLYLMSHFVQLKIKSIKQTRESDSHAKVI